MTFRAKLKEEYPEKVDENCAGGCVGCPSNYGYEENYNCNGVTCKECWNREMPNTEPKEDVGKKWFMLGCENGKNLGYDQGLNDAWELARKLVHFEYEGGFSDKEIQTIFDCDEWQCVFNTYTPQEALAKLKAYEEAQNEIYVGDVVTYSGEKGMVLDCPYDKFLVLTHDGWVQEWYECDVEKTGKHIDIKSILESIGE